MILTCFHTVLVRIDVDIDHQHDIVAIIRPYSLVEESLCFDVTVIDVFKKLFEDFRIILRERDLQCLAFFEVLEAF